MILEFCKFARDLNRSWRDVYYLCFSKIIINWENKNPAQEETVKELKDAFANQNKTNNEG